MEQKPRVRKTGSVPRALPASPAGLEGWGTGLTLAGISDSFIITLSILQCTSNLLILFEHLGVFDVTFILARYSNHHFLSLSSLAFFFFF